MKRQHPTSKFQKSFKIRGSKSDLGAQVVRYPEPSPLVSFLKDGANGVDNARHVFDLEERTAKFGEAIVRFSKRIPRGPTTNRLIDQLVGCGSSVGANYPRGERKLLEKGFLVFHQSLCQRGQRDEILSPPDRCLRGTFGRRSSRTLP